MKLGDEHVEQSFALFMLVFCIPFGMLHDKLHTLFDTFIIYILFGQDEIHDRFVAEVINGA